MGMALVSTGGEILTANAALGEMLGYDPDELAHHTVADLTHPDDLETDLDLMRKAVAGSTTSYRVPKRCFRRDGSLLHGELSALLLRDTDGEPLQFIMQIIDRTEVHAFAERLDAAEETTHDLLSKGQAILDGVSVGSPAGRRRRDLQRVEPAPAGAPRHRLPRRPRRSCRPARIRVRRRAAGGAVLRPVPVRAGHRGRGGGVRRPAHLDRRGPGEPSRAVGLGEDRARPWRGPHGSGAGLQRRDRADPRREGQGRVRVHGLPRAAYAADGSPGLPRAPRRVGGARARCAPAGDRDPAQHAAALAPARRPDPVDQGLLRVARGRPLPRRPGHRGPGGRRGRSSRRRGSRCPAHPRAPGDPGDDRRRDPAAPGPRQPHRQRDPLRRPAAST